MSNPGAVLHLLCGKIASGKSTLAAKLASHPSTLLIAEDIWLGQLYPDEIKTVTDYVLRSKRLKQILGSHIIDVLRAGTSVVLDFPANTVSDRQWLRALADQARVNHVLHFLDVDDATCLARLRSRNSTGNHAFQTSDVDFALITSYFMPPGQEEGFHIMLG